MDTEYSIILQEDIYIYYHLVDFYKTIENKKKNKKKYNTEPKI